MGYSGVMEDEEETLRVSAAGVDAVPCQNTLWGCSRVMREEEAASNVCSDMNLFSNVLPCIVLSCMRYVLLLALIKMLCSCSRHVVTQVVSSALVQRYAEGVQRGLRSCSCYRSAEHAAASGGSRRGREPCLRTPMRNLGSLRKCQVSSQLSGWQTAAPVHHQGLHTHGLLPAGSSMAAKCASSRPRPCTAQPSVMVACTSQLSQMSALQGCGLGCVCPPCGCVLMAGASGLPWGPRTDSSE